MASETTPLNSRNRDISLFLPFFLGLNSASPTEDQAGPIPPDRIILINPSTQGMVVIERGRSNNTSFLGFDSLLDDLFSGKGGQPPASKASIDAMETVEIGGGDCNGDQCVICLEEWEGGEKAKEMPCKHRFHGDCIEKWLKIHGSCPVCRYQMPVDDQKRPIGEEGDGERRRREIWVSFTFSRERRSEEANQDNSSERSDSFTSDQEIQS